MYTYTLTHQGWDANLTVDAGSVRERALEEHIRNQTNPLCQCFAKGGIMLCSLFFRGRGGK